MPPRDFGFWAKSLQGNKVNQPLDIVNRLHYRAKRLCSEMAIHLRLNYEKSSALRFTQIHMFSCFSKSRNSSFSSSLWPLNKRSEDAFFKALASIWSNIFTSSNEKKICLLLCLLCIFKFQTLTCQNFRIFYFTLRLTLYECVVNICIQRWFLIRNWTILLAFSW